MYAIIQTGGKQYRVAPGETLRVEKIRADEGAFIDFNEVLLVGDGDDIKVGAPFVEGGRVMARVGKHARDKKIKIVKFRRRKHYRKQMGHRQSYTELQIIDITPARHEASKVSSDGADSTPSTDSPITVQPEASEVSNHGT